jgi:peptidoglycan hydrolase-like protein with peptidoglycan-binding domain
MINKKNILISGGLMLTLALAMLISVPRADAYTVNITAGQDLTIGSTGQNVVVLQGLMSELGYLNIPMGIAHGYYGSMTQAAVASYQAAHSVTPTAGYFGSLTKTAMHQEFAQHGWLSLLGWY